MNRIESAKQNGCMHCLTSTSFIEEMKGNKKTLTCVECGCIHYEDGFSYTIPAKNFESHQFIQRSYRENEELMESYKKSKEVIQEEIAEDK